MAMVMAMQAGAMPGGNVPSLPLPSPARPLLSLALPAPHRQCEGRPLLSTCLGHDVLPRRGIDAIGTISGVLSAAQYQAASCATRLRNELSCLCPFCLCASLF